MTGRNKSYYVNGSSGLAAVSLKEYKELTKENHHNHSTIHSNQSQVWERIDFGTDPQDGTEDQAGD